MRFWPLIAFLVVTGHPVAVWRLSLLIRNRNREPGGDTLWDGVTRDRAKAEMMLRQGYRNRDRTTKL